MQAYSEWMGCHCDLFAPRHIQGEFVIRPGLLPGGSRPSMAVWGGYEKPAYPGTSGPEKGFWWFPAPDQFCWHLQELRE